MIRNLGNLFDVKLVEAVDDELRLKDALAGVVDDEQIAEGLQSLDDATFSTAVRNRAKELGKAGLWAAEIDRSLESNFTNPNESGSRRPSGLYVAGVPNGESDLIARLDLEPDGSSLFEMWKVMFAKRSVWSELGGQTSGMLDYEPPDAQTVKLLQLSSQTIAEFHDWLVRFSSWTQIPVKLDANPRNTFNRLQLFDDIETSLPSPGASLYRNRSFERFLLEECHVDTKAVQESSETFEVVWNDFLNALAQGIMWGPPRVLQVSNSRLFEYSGRGRTMPVWRIQPASNFILPTTTSLWNEFKQGDESLLENSSPDFDSVQGGRTYNRVDSLQQFNRRTPDRRLPATRTAFWREIRRVRRNMEAFARESERIEIQAGSEIETTSTSTEREKVERLFVRTLSWLQAIGRVSHATNNSSDLPDEVRPEDDVLGDYNETPVTRRAALIRSLAGSFLNVRGYSGQRQTINPSVLDSMQETSVRRVNRIDINDPFVERQQQFVLHNPSKFSSERIPEIIVSDSDIRFEEGEEWLEESSKKRQGFVDALEMLASGWNSESVAQVINRAFERHFGRLGDFERSLEAQTSSPTERELSALSQLSMLTALASLEEEDENTFEVLAAATFVEWSKINASLIAELRFDKILQENILSSAQSSIPSSSDLQSSNSFQFGFLPNSLSSDGENNIVEYISNELVGPIFTAFLEGEVLLESPLRDLSAGTTAWLGLSQIEIWSTILLLVSSGLKLAEETTSPSEILSSSLSQLYGSSQSNFIAAFNDGAGLPEIVYRKGIFNLLEQNNPLSDLLIGPSSVTKQSSDWIRACAWFVMGIELETQDVFGGLLDALKGAEKAPAPTSGLVGALEASNAFTGRLGALWKATGNMQSALFRSEVLWRLAWADQANRSLQIATGPTSGSAGVWGGRRGEVPRGFGILEVPEGREVPVNILREMSSDGLTRIEQVPFLVLLGKLLRQSGMGADALTRKSDSNSSAVLVAGMPREYNWSSASQKTVISTRWKDFLNGFEMTKEFIFDEALFPKPVVANFSSYVTDLEAAEMTASASIEVLLEQWWEFVIPERLEGSMSIKRFSFNEIVELYKGRSGLSGTEWSSVRPLFIQMLCESVLSEMLKMWSKFMWDFDFDEANFGAFAPEGFAALGVEERRLRTKVLPRAFAGIKASPWSREFIVGGSLLQQGVPTAANADARRTRIFWNAPVAIPLEERRAYLTRERFAALTSGELGLRIGNVETSSETWLSNVLENRFVLGRWG